jgi:sugar (pentulose or hexulose) kinase
MVTGKGYVIAIDLGASGAKMGAMWLDNGTIHREDIYTFPNVPLELGPGLYWDFFDLYKNILRGLSYFASKYGEPYSIGIDTWGATYGFLDARGRLAEPVFHYRDKRTGGVLERLYDCISREDIFKLTGCQCASSYTLVQLYASVLQNDIMLNNAKQLVLLPDLLAYFLGGDISTERTIAGTTAMMEPSQRDWSAELLAKLRIPADLLPPLTDTGRIKGRLHKALADETGLGQTLIVSAIGHDSAAAVAAIPGFDTESLYISIGTNISMGTYRDTPALEDVYYTWGFKNTGGDGGRIIVYRDFPAAWVLNRLHGEWLKTDKTLGFDDLDALAADAGGGVFFDIEDPVIQAAGGQITGIITELVKKTGQPLPQSRGEFVLSVMKSIALRVRYYAGKLAQAQGKDFNKIFIISGAIRYKTLVALIGNALGRPVYVGLPYATLLGNAVSQFYALGELAPSQYRADEQMFNEIRPLSAGDWQGDLEWAVEKGIVP